MMRASRFVVGSFTVTLAAAALGAQQDRPANEARSAARVLDPADLAGWKSIRATAWSLDGRLFAYQLAPNEGDAEVVIKTVADGKETRLPIGEPPAGFGGGPGGPAPGSPLGVSGDGKWVAFLKYPLAKDAKRMRKDKKPLQSSVMIVDLATGKTREFERVRRFAFDGEKPTVVALHRYADAASAPSPAPAAPAPPAAPGAPAASAAADLLIVQLAGTQVTHIGDVNEFAFDDKGEYLAWTVETRDRFGNGVHLRHAKTEATRVLDSERAVYRRLTWADSGASLTVLRGIPDSAAADTNYALVAWRDVALSPIAYTPTDTSGMPAGMRLSGDRPPRWVWDRSAIFLGVAERRVSAPGEKPSPDVKAVAGAPGAIAGGGGGARSDDDALPSLIIWHGNDSRLQSQQQVEESRDKAFSYLAAYRVTDQRLVRLGNDSLRDISLTARDRYAFGFDVRAYERSGNIDGRRYRDVYAIDLRTGAARLLTKKFLPVGFFGGGMSSSPDGNRLLYWSDGNYHVHDLSTGTSRNITAGAQLSFVNKEDDHNIDRPPTPMVGWTKDGESVLLSDNWDVWRVPVRGGAAVNLTMAGRAQGLRFQRRIQVDPKERGIDLTKPVYFAVYGERTKKSGIARVDAAKPGAAMLLLDDAQYFASRARDADAWFFSRQTFTEYPDYWTADGTFKSARRLTDVGTQQKDVTWSSGARLIDYVSDKGDSLQGALFLPANYEAGKKYPTVVYIYEKLSQGLHAYAVPNETRAFNPSVYTSRGYAVLMPDIVYRVNDPGMSAVWCVVPAVKAAIATGIVDAANVGLHGHSWGGYQTAFLVTQTNVFKSAIAGAALTDMVSMYSSVYWNTGSANQPIFESSQGRFTGNFIDNYDAYIRNSPAFHAKSVKTPLLLLHNERDGAVDFNQGITYYNTLRQLGKDVVLLQYVGENHGLAQPENQKDYTIRMKEYFDHHLVGAPAPEWLKNGIPRLKMQEHLKARQKKVAS